jgi:hypothetical protein
MSSTRKHYVLEYLKLKTSPLSTVVKQNNLSYCSTNLQVNQQSQCMHNRPRVEDDVYDHHYDYSITAHRKCSLVAAAYFSHTDVLKFGIDVTLTPEIPNVAWR